MEGADAKPKSPLFKGRFSRVTDLTFAVGTSYMVNFLLFSRILVDDNRFVASDILFCSVLCVVAR